MQINILSLCWLSSNGGEFIKQEFPVHPGLNGTQEAYIEAFKMGIDAYIEDTQDEIFSYEEAWKKNDPSVSSKVVASHPDKEIEKALNNWMRSK